MEINISGESNHHTEVESQHKILASSSAFGILRQQLVNYIGKERAKAFLYHFGWVMGVNDAKEALKAESSLEKLIKLGPDCHISNGHVRAMQYEGFVRLDDHNHIFFGYGAGTWIQSYEAEEHIKLLGASNDNVCYTLSGFASGYMSTIIGQPLFVKEVTCVGKGDSACSWIIKTKDDWKNEGHGSLLDYDEWSVVKGLEITYEQLKEQQNFITRLSHFQRKLTEEVSNGSTLVMLAEMVNKTVQLPIIIEDVNFRTNVYAGLTVERYSNLKEDMDVNRQRFPFHRKTVKTMMQERLIAPILVQKEIVGYCSFIYEIRGNRKLEDDYVFLERFANAASLILLNEKTMFMSFERMKGIFLEQILEAKMPASEWIKKGRYSGIDLAQPYYIVNMNDRKTFRSIEEEYHSQEQIFSFISRFFYEKKQNILIGQRNGNMVLLITSENDRKGTIHEVIEALHDELLIKFPQGDFKFGISRESNNIHHARQSYEEATIALRLSIKKQIVTFESLGIVGMLLDTGKISQIKATAEEQLGPLYQTNNPKNIELLKTLYTLLLNGGKLEQTMKDLSISMSGLRHRIRKIEALLQLEIRENPQATFKLLLVLEALVALGELDLSSNS